ncbi:PIN domain-containing protein [Candidatus Micrarchaeota archaeon]|nr:PIN domain-containing protein [Candidatus Micrarchaeota archaeon]
MTKVLIDSNILVYAADNSDERKHETAKRVIERTLNEGTGVISLQNLVEFARVVTEKVKNPLSFDEAREMALEFSDSFEVLTYDQKTVGEALHFASRYRIHFFDALLVATMEENLIKGIITENEDDFKGIAWLNVSNPFKER